jgi:hypothetical protein
MSKDSKLQDGKPRVALPHLWLMVLVK